MRNIRDSSRRRLRIENVTMTRPEIDIMIVNDNTNNNSDNTDLIRCTTGPWVRCEVPDPDPGTITRTEAEVTIQRIEVVVDLEVLVLLDLPDKCLLRGSDMMLLHRLQVNIQIFGHSCQARLLLLSALLNSIN